MSFLGEAGSGIFEWRNKFEESAVYRAALSRSGKCGSTWEAMGQQDPVAISVLRHNFEQG